MSFRKLEQQHRETRGKHMKRTSYLCLGVLLMAAMPLAISAAQTQDTSLADYARARKKDKPATTKKSYDNDNLPKDEHISVVGQEPSHEQQSEASAPATSSETASSSGAAKASDDSKPAKTEVTPGESPEDREKVYADWQKKIADQKSALDLAQRELDVAQREYRMRSAAVYADVGYRLRNAAQWDKEDQQYKQQIAAKQKAVDAAKQGLATMQEQARKSGVPSKLRE
jgi:hypothetical protein